MYEQFGPTGPARAQIGVMTVHNHFGDTGPFCRAGKNEPHALVQVQVNDIVRAGAHELIEHTRIAVQRTDATAKLENFHAKPRQSFVVYTGANATSRQVNGQTGTIHMLEEIDEKRLDTARLPFLAKAENVHESTSGLPESFPNLNPHLPLWANIASASRHQTGKHPDPLALKQPSGHIATWRAVTFSRLEARTDAI